MSEQKIHGRRKVWNLETFFLSLVGVAMILRMDLVHSFGVIGETIVLVVFLGGLMGITRIPFPSKFPNGTPIPLWAYPVISGVISGFMDSFLVLLLVGAAKMEGKERHQFLFKAINMIAALIGGLTMYFGEVYALPLCLKYGLRHWHSMIPLFPPIAVFLAVLAGITARLEVRVVGMESLGNGESANHSNGKKIIADAGDYCEFAVAILLLLISQNALFCLGVLLIYSFITGQGEDLLDVLKTETEVDVMLLLVFAAFIAPVAEPWMVRFSGWWAFFPATVNGVLTGAIYPAEGNFWREIHILSTAVLLTPISSLVGIMLFKTIKEWKDYIVFAVPMAIVWFLLAGAWIYGPWEWYFKEPFQGHFGAPALVQEEGKH